MAKSPNKRLLLLLQSLPYNVAAHNNSLQADRLDGRRPELKRYASSMKTEIQRTCQTAKITKLIIKNFGCIGPQGVSIDIDKIVVLVGANNAGKSTILRALEVVADCLKLEQDDFHNRQVLADNFPDIEIHSIVTQDNKPGDEWCQLLPDGTWLIKEKWTWHSLVALAKLGKLQWRHYRKL